MVNTEINRIQTQSLIEQLKSLQLGNLDADLTISNAHRRGVIHVRGGTAISAHVGVLHGNGAILTLAQMSETHIELTPDSSTVQKTVFISVGQIERFLTAQKIQPRKAIYCDEEKLLQDAKNLFFQFHYKEAVEKLITILRYNRFFYPAWLWQSRILTRQDYISKALDEAYRWGNHDQDVWREARKIRPQIQENGEPVKRCIFCWSILNQNSSCEHCHAYPTITERPLPANVKHNEIKFALNHFSSAFQLDTTNARLAYTLALGYFNLKQFSTALSYMQVAEKLSPQSVIYRKSMSLLLATAGTQAASVNVPPTPDPTNARILPTILIIEDSMTSRKVLSILFSRLGYRLIEAGSGTEALEAAQTERPNIILLDIMLPDTNGHDLLTQLRSFDHLREVPVIMLTGKHDTKDRIKGIQGGANEYITKPFNPQKLTTLLQHYLPATEISVASPSHKKPVENQYSAPEETPVPHTAVPVQLKSALTEDSTRSFTDNAAKSSSKSIFVIEDSITSRKVLSMILGRNGYTMHEASTGQEALQLAKSIKPDLVLLDVMLPDMTGYTVLPQLKQFPHFADLPVIMLTGKNSATDRMKGMIAGSNEYLTKPFDPKKLLTLIGSYI